MTRITRLRWTGRTVLAVILVGHSFDVTFWWSVAFTGLAVLPALILPGRSRAAALGRAASGTGRRTELAEPVRLPGRSPG